NGSPFRLLAPRSRCTPVARVITLRGRPASVFCPPLRGVFTGTYGGAGCGVNGCTHGPRPATKRRPGPGARTAWITTAAEARLGDRRAHHPQTRHTRPTPHP